jgi:hypothetical protein
VNTIDSKYGLLTESEKKQIDDAIDIMLSKKNFENKVVSSSYSKNLLKVSNWTDEEIKDLEQNMKTFGKWQVGNW